MKFTAFFSYIIFFCLLLSCNASNDNSKKFSSRYQLCFKNEYRFRNDASIKDVLELKISVDHEKVTGNFNWIPAKKDARLGSFTGTIHSNIIKAEYRFLQEGINDTVPITITLHKNNAVVKGGDIILGLDATLTKTDCE